MGDKVKGPADYFQLGDWNATCSISGFKRKASKLVRNWQGLYRIPEFNEPRQPQDFVRGMADNITPPWVQPDEDTDLVVCTFNGCSAIPGWAYPGCSVPGRTAIQPVWGMFGFNFTSNAAGQSSAILTQPIPFFFGTYQATFTDGEIRNVLFDGVSASWAPPLSSLPAGLVITGLYTIIGTF